jgi:amino-acid N-acetyltransferase
MSAPARAVAFRPRPAHVPERAAQPHVELRAAMPRDVEAVHRLIERYRDDGHLLPRTRDDIAARVEQFVVAIADGTVVGCAELVPLGNGVAEVRSLVVSAEVQGLGVGSALVARLIETGREKRYGRVCALTHAPAFFVRLGFSIVPHLTLPEKVFTDCVRCPLFRQCGQQAVVLSLPASEASVPRRRAS